MSAVIDDFIVDGKPLSDLRVVDLKMQLEKRGLSKSGSKHVLVSRLRDHLCLERIQEEQSHKDPNAVPNMEMKSCGSNIVAEYLERQQQALQAAKKVAQAVRAASSSSFDDTEQSPIAAVESLVASLSPKQAPARLNESVSEGNESFEKEQRKVEREAEKEPESGEETEKAPEKETEPEKPLNLSKDEEKSPEAKMVQEKKEEMVAERREVVPEEPEEETTAEPAPEVEEAAPEVNDDESRSTDENNSVHEEPQASEDLGEEEVEISAPQNAADEIMEAANADFITEKRLSKEIKEVTPPEAEVGEKRQRKRKWGSTAKRTTVSISSESLKEIVGPVSATETATAATTLDEPVQLDYDEEPVPKRIVISREDMDEEDTQESAPKQMEKAEIVVTAVEPTPDEDGLIRERSASPARHPYLDEESATAARAKLDNARWPSSNPHMLRVDFASQEDLDRHRNKVKLTQNSKPEEPQPLASKENHTESKPKERVVREIRATDDESGRRRLKKTPTPPREPKSREWDKGKDWKRGQSPKRRSPSPGRRGRDANAKRDEIPAKLLDDLFKKTKTTPCIYWLPLTSDQVNEREFERKRREIERLERLKQMEREDRERGRPYYDRRPPSYGRRR